MKIAKDKIGHFKLGFYLGLTALVLGWYAMIPVFIAAAGKEARDYFWPVMPGWMPEYFRRPGCFEVLDFIATMLGGLVGVGIAGFLLLLGGL